MIFDTNKYDFFKPLQSEWKTVRNELEAAMADSFKSYKDERWSLLTLFKGFYDAEKRTKVVTLADGPPPKDEENCPKFPRTVELLESVPGLKSAGFSRFKAGFHATPHVGHGDNFVRCHLGLIVPEPDKCTLTVEGQTVHWEEGGLLMFDDSCLHEARNNGSQDRIVLIFDLFKEAIDKIFPLKDALVDKSVGEKMQGVKQHARWYKSKMKQKLA